MADNMLQRASASAALVHIGADISADHLITAENVDMVILARLEIRDHQLTDRDALTVGSAVGLEYLNLVCGSPTKACDITYSQTGISWS